jgi:hypothetical protein
VGQANEVFADRRVTVKDMAAWFGVGPARPGQRAKPILQAFGAEPDVYPYGLSSLSSPDHLTSATRAKIIAVRDSLG